MIKENNLFWDKSTEKVCNANIRRNCKSSNDLSDNLQLNFFKAYFSKLSITTAWSKRDRPKREKTCLVVVATILCLST